MVLLHLDAVFQHLDVQLYTEIAFYTVTWFYYTLMLYFNWTSRFRVRICSSFKGQLGSRTVTVCSTFASSAVLSQSSIDQLEMQNEKIERMTLRDRVKAIFKKYGFTVLGCSISCRCGHWCYRG